MDSKVQIQLWRKSLVVCHRALSFVPSFAIFNFMVQESRCGKMAKDSKPERVVRSRMAESGFKMIPTHWNNGLMKLKEDKYELLLLGLNTRCAQGGKLGLQLLFWKMLRGSSWQKSQICQRQIQLVKIKWTNIQTNKNPQSNPRIHDE